MSRFHSKHKHLSSEHSGRTQYDC